MAFILLRSRNWVSVPSTVFENGVYDVLFCCALQGHPPQLNMATTYVLVSPLTMPILTSQRGRSRHYDRAGQHLLHQITVPQYPFHVRSRDATRPSALVLALT